MTLMDKRVVAIYTTNYLSISATFIYRQIRGLSDQFKPIVLASEVENLDLFPFEPIYVKNRSCVGRVISKAYRQVSRKYAALGPCQVSYWRDVLKKEGVRLIHAHFGPAGLGMLPLSKNLGLPLLVTFHGYDASRLLRDKVYLHALEDLFDNAYAIAVSRQMRERLVAIGADPSRVTVHHIGVPTDVFHYIPRISIAEKVRRGEIVEFLQVSNFVEKKGHEYTVVAFQGLLATYPQSRLILAGDGPLRLQIELQCRELGIEDKVRFVGKVSRPQVIELMTQADVFVHHSVTAENGDQEGIPTVLMEAMSTGLVVISTLHSGIPELIDSGLNGYLVAERDVSGYTDKLADVLGCGVEIGQRASEKINGKFNMTVQNVKLEDIYVELMNG